MNDRINYMALILMLVSACITGAEGDLQRHFDEIFNAPQSASKGISDLESLVLINNELGLQMYRQIDNQDANLVYSPYSIATALQMAYAGAAGLTQSQMARVLHFTPAPQVLNSSAEALVAQLTPPNKRTFDDPTLLMSNSLWVQSGHPVLPDFEKSITENYKGSVKGLDFRNKGEQAITEINNWVKAQTKGKVSEILGPGDISNATRMLLMSTLYLNGKWEHAFDPRLTRAMPFFPYPSKTITLPMMTLTADLPYVVKNNFTAVELDYATKAANPKLAMIIILPKETFGLKDVEASLSAQGMVDLLKELKPARLTISMPKFKVSSTLNLKNVLEKMGLNEPFSQHADFSGMDGTQDLRMGAILQKVYLSADEKGTEAGLATAVPFDLRAIKGASAELFVVDHPFMFYVVDKITGAILFIGRIIQP